VLIVLAIGAVLVGAVDAVGWLWWQEMSRTLESNATDGADRLLHGKPMALPTTAQLGRRLTLRSLTAAPTSLVVIALERISGHQKRWLWVDPNGFENAAVAALISQRMEGGLDQLRGALSRDPTSPRLHRLMALVLKRAGNEEGFLDHLAEAEAIAAAPAGDPRLELSDTALAQVRLEALRRRLDRYPRQRANAAVALARELKKQGQNARAADVLRAHVGHPEVALEHARWHLDAGSFVAAENEALAIAERRRYPTSLRVDAWTVVAEVRHLAGDPAGAVAAAHEALRLGPDSAAPYVALATLAERGSAPGEAVEHLRRAWGVAPTDIGVVLRFAVAAERSGDIHDARLALERAVELEPDDPSVAARLVDFHLRHGEFTEAALRLSAALDRFPTDQRLLSQAERLRREVGQPGR
jgi:Tfp pilus assembly protein PilF